MLLVASVLLCEKGKQQQWGSCPFPPLPLCPPPPPPPQAPPPPPAGEQLSRMHLLFGDCRFLNFSDDCDTTFANSKLWNWVDCKGYFLVPFLYWRLQYARTAHNRRTFSDKIGERCEMWMRLLKFSLSFLVTEPLIKLVVTNCNAQLSCCPILHSLPEHLIHTKWNMLTWNFWSKDEGKACWRHLQLFPAAVRQSGYIDIVKGYSR